MIKDQASATVRTLVAEVRVLMLGQRQVTTGIARQLDVVKPDEIEPFGRVEARAIGCQGPRHVNVVGRHKAMGVLVRSRAHAATETEAYVAWSALPLIVLASR